MASFIPPTTPLMEKISILVVDDDFTSLSIVSGMLKKLNYQVTSAQSPYIALCTLRARRDLDLVVTDLHMPGMNGLQLKQLIDEDFKLPVIIMSADDQESVIVESFIRGVVLYIVKPVNPEDLKNIWQYVNVNENGKGKSPVIEEIQHIDQGESIQLDNNIVSEDYGQYLTPPGSVTSALSLMSNDSDESDDDGGKLTNKIKCSRKEKEIVDDQNNWILPAPRRNRLMWSFMMHLQFLEAITCIGFDKAVPRRILEVMNVPGLTRENVASHLQKYRNFLKKLAKSQQSESETLTERELRSTFATAHALMLRRQQYLFYLQQHNRMRGITHQQVNQTMFDIYNNVGIGSNGNFRIQPDFVRSESALYNGGQHGMDQPFQFTGTDADGSAGNNGGGYGYGNGNGNVVAPTVQVFGNETEFNFDNFVNSPFVFDSAFNFQAQPQNQTQGGDMHVNANIAPVLSDVPNATIANMANNGTNGNNVLSPLGEYCPLMDNQNATNQTQIHVGETVNNNEVNNNNTFPSNNALDNQIWDNDFIGDWFGFGP